MLGHPTVNERHPCLLRGHWKKTKDADFICSAVNKGVMVGKGAL